MKPYRTILALAALAFLSVSVATVARAATLEEALDAPGLIWTTGGGVSWFGQNSTTHDGVDAAECGGLTNAYSESWLATTVTGRVAVLFWWRSVSPGGQHFGFWFHTNGTYLEGLYGNVDWRQTMVSFAEGTNTLKWTSILGGVNPAAPIATNWLDQVVVTNIAGLKPTFLVQPEPSVTMPENYPDHTNLQVRAIGDIPMTYQWQRDGTNLTEAWPFSGVTTPTLRLDARTAADAGDYRVVLSNAWGMTTSQVCSVSVVPAKPAFYPFQPADVILAPGAYHSFNYVSVFGTSPFTLQWLKDGTPIPDGIIDFAAFADAGGYSLVATNAYGASTSRVAQITVSTDLPTIVSGPEPEVREVMPGEYADFYVQASGPETLSYSWRRVGDAAELATWDSIWFEAVDPANTGFYYVIVANNNGAVTSRLSVLAVSPVTALGLALDAPQLVVTNNSDWPLWSPDVQGVNAHDEFCAARSPAFQFGSSAFSTVVTGPTNVSFWWRISAASEVFLDVAVDGSVSNTISGETAWAQQPLVLSAGEHTLTWTFRKETYDVAGADAAWVDQIVLGDLPSTGTEITNFAALGDAPEWYQQTTNTHDGVEAWQSGDISDDETNRLTANVTGPGTLTFWWQVDSEEGCDFLEFWLDGVPQAGISGQTNWHQLSYVLGTGSHTLEWLYDKDGSQDVQADAGWVDEVMFTPTTGLLTLEQALNVTILTFTTGGDAPWFIETTNSHDGVAVQSGPIGDSQQSWLRTTVAGPGTLTFWYAHSTENGKDWFYLSPFGDWGGGSGGVYNGWSQQTMNIPDGTHTLEWRYEKDGSGSDGSDAAWLDEVSFAPAHAGQPPGFVLDPTNQTVEVDAMLQFAVQATGELPVTYTLLHEGNPVHIETVAASGPIMLSRWITSAADAGRYWAAATNAFGGATSAVAQVTVINPARILSSAGNRVVLRSRDFTLTVTAAGEPPLAYQWFKNGAPIPYATYSLLDISEANYGDAADYFVTVTNALRMATSSVARVSVTPWFYKVRNLGTLSTNSDADSEAYDVNNLGEVVGYSETDEWQSGARIKHGFVWLNSASNPAGTMFDLGDGRQCVNVASTNRLPGHSFAYSINDHFDIAGQFEYRVNPTQSGDPHAALWRQLNCGVAGPFLYGSHCPLELLDVHPKDIYVYPPDTEAVSINNRRQMLLRGGWVWTLAHYGYLLTLSDPLDRFSPLVARNLGVSDGYIVPNALNNSGLAVGRYLQYIGGDMPYLYDGTPHIGSDATSNLFFGEFRSVNDKGVIAGFQRVSVQGANVLKPFLLQPDGRFAWLSNPTVDPWYFQVNDINNNEQIVGQNNALQGMLYTDGQWLPLKDLIVGGGVDIVQAHAINDRGQIAATTGGWKACLLTPTSGSPNQSPVAVNDEQRLPRLASIRIPTYLLTANDSDPDGDGLSVVTLGEGTTTTTQAGGTASLQGDAIFYTPPSGQVTSDQFSYTAGDAFGGRDSAHVTLILDAAAPPPQPLLNPPQRRPDGQVLLSGQAPYGSMVIIYSASNPLASYWKRDTVIIVPASGQWSVVRPGGPGNQPVFYKAEFFEGSF